MLWIIPAMAFFSGRGERKTGAILYEVIGIDSEVLFQAVRLIR